MLEQKIETLKNLFSQRDEIDRQIKEIIECGNKVIPQVKNKIVNMQTVTKNRNRVCAECKRERRIIGRGLCGSCYTRVRRIEKNDKLVKLPKTSDVKNYKCEKCEMVFKSAVGYLDVVCPVCKSTKILKLK